MIKFDIEGHAKRFQLCDIFWLLTLTNVYQLNCDLDHIYKAQVYSYLINLLFYFNYLCVLKHNRIATAHHKMTSKLMGIVF